MLHSVCVFTGSRSGSRPSYSAAAVAMGAAIAGAGLRLVYGGGAVGLMKTVADAALAAGGEVVGVIPADLQARELRHTGLTELHVVRSMHERKMKMAQLSDAIIALPGGLGTLEELFEIWTWAQLGFHQKPTGLLNTDGFYDGLLAFLDVTVREGFVAPSHRAMLITGTEAQSLLDAVLTALPQSNASARDFSGS
jgi:uncharacterized protein (TIGR00730 family)